MRRVLSYFLSLIMFFSSFSIGMISTKAAGEHQFIVKGYDWNALDNDWEGSGTGDELTDEMDVEPGRVIQIQVYYVPGNQTDLMMQIGLKYDADLVEPMYYDDEVYVETDMSTTYNGGMWPAKGTSPNDRKATNWQVTYNDHKEESQINLLVQDSTSSKPLTSDGVIASVYFKIKEEAKAGSTVNFSINETYTALANKSKFTTKGLSLNVFGEMNDSTTLSSFKVSKDGTDYPFDPEFVPDSSDTKDFNIVVPNHVESVDISATPTDSYTQIASGDGNTSLQVGNNDKKIIVQAQDGTQEIYILHIYRLNNDATLSSLSLTNDVNIGVFNKDTLSYSAIVPYKTSSTVVIANQTDENAEIKSGQGSWSLDNYGDNLNNRDVVVEAENCKESYKTVPGNSCTKKTYHISVTREAPSNNANLSDLQVNGATVKGFNQGLYTYTLDRVSYETTSIEVNAIVEDVGKAVIETDLGTKQLNVGDNKIDIVVRAEDGTTKKTYSINVRRLSNNSKLATLTVTSDPLGTLSPQFSSDLYDYYTYSAPATVKTVNIEATVQDTGNANIISGTGQYDIDTNPTVNVIVLAEDGTSSTYVIKLVRDKSANNNLKSLQIDGYSLNEEFNPNTTLYTADVSGDVTQVNISAEVEDTGKAQILSGTGLKELRVGPNTVQVRVKAENGATKDYTITITRAKKKISALTDIKVDNNSIDGFEEGKLEYTLDTVDFEKTSVNIEVVKKDPDSTVTGDGERQLNTGDNKLYIRVTAEDGETQTTYILNIERKKDSNAYLRDLQIDGQTIDDFSPETLSYGLTVENDVTSLNINAIPQSESAEAVISNNENFVTTETNVVTITVTAEDGSMQIYKIHVTRKKSDNNYLKNITVSSGVLDPVFKKTTNDYTVNVDRSVTTIVITPEVENKASQFQLSGPDSLSIGPNIYKITVTSETGNDNVYTITVNRNPSDNNYLASLLVDDEPLQGFERTKFLYQIEVPSTKENIKIDGRTEEEHATTKGFGTFDLDAGVNTFEIEVTAENGTPRTYSIVVNKSKSDNSALSDLSITQTTLNPSFQPEILEYTANVAYGVTNIDIIAVASDKKSKVTGDGPKELKTGENPFEIVVTSENNTTTTYRVVVTRAKNNNANLSNILISGGYPLDKDFNPNDTEYSVKVPNAVGSVTITAYKEDPNAVSVTGAGLVELHTGVNEIKITVTAEDGKTQKVYTINIEREKSNDATLKELTVTGGNLSPEFSPEENNYEVTVPYEITEFDATAVPTSDAARVELDENKTLDVGSNTKRVTVTAEDGTVNIYEIEILRQPSSNNFLSNLSVTDKNQQEYITAFNKTTLIYNITVENDIDEITITATPDDNSSNVSGDGKQKVGIGNNSYDVKVKSASNVERVYTIKVFRKANSNNFLSSLTVSDGELNPEFRKDTVSYTVDVDSEVTNITIEATPEVETSQVTGTGTFELHTGVNPFNVVVTAEDQTTLTYVVVVNKAASSNNYLSNLTVTPGELTPKFSREELEYSVHLPNETTTITINAEAEQKDATIEGDGIKSVNVGEETYEITVKAEDNSTRVYKVKVKRDASSVKDLKSLKVDGELVEGFNKDVTTYYMNVENDVTSVNIEAEVLDPTSNVTTGIGEQQLSTGNNVIKVTVQAEDGTLKVYELNIERAKSSNNYLSNLVINDGNFTPEFSRETITYYITVPYEVVSLNLVAIKEDKAATIEIDGNSDFVVGSTNKVYINVIAENSDVKTYTINVTRQPQANNFLNNIIVTGDDGINYNLSPSFNRTTYSYDVEIPKSVTEVDITVEKQSQTLSVTGDGKVTITSFPQIQKIVVSTTGGIERTYTLKFVKGLSSNNKLTSITVDKGTLDPPFNEDELAYNVDLPEGTKDITISATKGDEEQNITGLGLMKLSPGRNTAKIVVTSENGTIRTYTIFINVATNNRENVLTSLTVDKGQLEPSFDKDTKLYTVDLQAEEEDITISATGNNSITGTGLHSLEEGANVFEIVTTDDSGEENIYRVVVNRGSIKSTYLKYLKVENYDMNEEFNKDTLSYTMNIYDDISSLDVIAIPEDKNATVTIDGNKNMTFGENNITIQVEDEDNNTKTYNIKVVIGNNKITSDIHTIDDKYIKTVEENKTSKDVKSEMTNPYEYLKIYDVNGSELLETDAVGTGCVIKLIINGQEYDSKTIIVKGDINGDGEVGVADVIKLRLHILETNPLNTYETLAADTNEDDDIGVADLVQIRSHILGSSNLYGKGGE